ncbi:precursor to secretory protein Ssp120 [Trametes coccinea BRFM310]|uniref:Precursor to secretory protein Ssp120 n=1 Tax=Trametes coccinea (strain BRFM310) TaxID=1353009 RepID=A0A1Y2J165_TRAC3|nr:precursor to secretory protein Ssp120 [Trametes coccinea BRFM310]
MQLFATLAFLASLRAAAAHGGHDKPAEGETIQQYALRHMATEHHIDTFDVPSFFHIHDLNRDGVWDTEEIEAVYGVHHVYSQKKSKDDIEHQKKAEHIVKEVLKRLDKDGNGKITLQEFEAVGLEGLPNFDDLGAEGHHYDVESEFFLHHEEQFHSTPETQTDESYNHPEDIEHFAHHEAIERQEAEREAKFQGVSVDEVISQHEPHEEQHVPEGDAADPQLTVQNPHDDQAPVLGGPPKINRVPPPEKQDPAVRFASAKADAENHGEWGAGSAGYKPPKSPSEKMRKNLPYKGRIQYKFRRTWGDF